MYTSGSAGKPEGIVHGHRLLAAHTPSTHRFVNLSMQDEDAVFWSPSDRAPVGGHLDMLCPGWMAGCHVRGAVQCRRGVVCSEFCGMTEVNQRIGNCAAVVRAGRGRWGGPVRGIAWCSWTTQAIR